MNEDVMVWLKRQVGQAVKIELNEEPEQVIVKDRMRAGTGLEPIHNVTAWVKLKERSHTVLLNLRDDGSYSNFEIVE